jgi:hypothetical protein
MMGWHHIETQNKKAIYNLYIPNRFDDYFKRRFSMVTLYQVGMKNGVFLQKNCYKTNPFFE